ncbi:MAG TPA: radical SAM protein [Planctomycetota bacterium]|jgi:23S rRNA (adenine2503-C2)-methyltransferase|nr:radical SAM protein [Planctomycetota bacterium]
MIPLQGVTPERLAEAEPGLALAEARRVVSAVHRGWNLDAPLPGLRRASLEAIRARAGFPPFERVAVRPSAVDRFVKLVFRTADGRLVEAVRIPLEVAGRFTVCVSSQVGCALGCLFCATGRLGLGRNLDGWEIVEQARAVRLGLDRSKGERLRGVVFQGMGEPLANLEATLEAIAVLTHPCALAVDARAITVSTAGLPGGIRRLAREARKVRLALSIGSALPEKRARLMPIERAHPLAEVLDASVEHARTTGYRPMWAYALLEGVNDGEEDAGALAALALSFGARSGIPPRISLLAYNAIDEAGRDPFRRSSPERETAFRDALRRAGVFTKRRYSGGADVAAACGQLAAREAV